MIALAGSFVASLVLALVLTYLVRGWASRFGWVDVPDGERRCHDRPIPRVGGIAIYASFVLVWLVVSWLFPEMLEPHRGSGLFFLLALGASGVFLLGLWDDIHGLSPRVKLAVEVTITVGLFAAGLRIEVLGLLGGEMGQLPFWASLVVTTLWIVGITNAFNLIDGSDGVAGGAALFATSSIFVISLLGGNVTGVLVSLVLAGAILGFLFFNFPPASIFLGDSGSLFIGFTLASLGVLTTQTATTALAVLIPVVSFGLPILDTVLAMLRRFLRREPIFRADRGHIHHRLRDLGHSPRQVVLLLYAACAIFAAISLLMVQPATRAAATTLLLVSGAVLWISIQRLHIPELLEVRRIMHRGLQQRVVIAHNVRIREAIHRLERASTPETVVQALGQAFGTGEFARAELWLEASAYGPLVQTAPFEVSGPGMSCIWGDLTGEAEEDLWELQLPYRLDGVVVSRLTLWCARQSDHLLTDLRLIALRLQPELHAALRRAGAPRLAAPAVAEAPEVARAESPAAAKRPRALLRTLVPSIVREKP